MKNPCKTRNPCTRDCPDRHPGCCCHDREVWLSELREYKRQERRRQLLDSYQIDATRDAQRGSKRRRKWRQA